jgi:hypothetical protein
LPLVPKYARTEAPLSFQRSPALSQSEQVQSRQNV